MKPLRQIRVMLALLVAVLLPLEQAHCALMPLRAAASAVQADHHDADGDDCCDESSTAPKPTSPTNSPCCCPCLQLPAATAPASISIPAPVPSSTLLAVSALPALAIHAGCVFGGITPDARSGSPPDPASASQSPRSPPYSA